MFVSEKAIFWLYDDDPDSESIESDPWDFIEFEDNLGFE